MSENGQYTFTAYAQDTAGNYTAVTRSIFVNLPETAPQTSDAAGTAALLTILSAVGAVVCKKR